MKKVKKITVRRFVDVSPTLEVSRKKDWDENYQDPTINLDNGNNDYDYANIN